MKQIFLLNYKTIRNKMLKRYKSVFKVAMTEDSVCMQNCMQIRIGGVLSVKLLAPITIREGRHK